MFQEWEHINLIKNKKWSNYICYWLIIHIIIYFILFILFSCYSIDKYYTVMGYYQNHEIEVLVDESFFQLSESILKFQGKEYDYQVISIEPMLYEDGNITIWKIVIEFPLSENYKIENNQFSLYFKKEKTTVLKQIIRSIKEVVEV